MSNHNLFLIVFVCFIGICYSSPFQLEIAGLNVSSSCLSAVTNYTNNGTYSKAAGNWFTYIWACAGSLNENTTSVSCDNSTNAYFSTYKTLCGQSLSVSNTTALTSKFCTLTLTGKPQSDPNVTYTITSDYCLPLACTKESSDITAFQDYLVDGLVCDVSPCLVWNATSSNAVLKCGGFPLWAIILIIIIIIIVVVLIIVGVVVMMRRKNQYQNL